MTIYKRISDLPRLFKAIFVVVLVLIFLLSNKFYNSDRKTCTNPYELKDFTSGVEKIEICKDEINRGSIKVLSKDEYPDLFEFILNGKPEKLKQYIRVFKKDNSEYISIKSVMDFTSWNTTAIGIYRKEDEEYELVFKKAFADNRGRWVNIEFGEDYTYRDPYFYLNSHGEGITISGDIGYLGCLGACRLLWWDYYEWSPKKKTFVLANNKHHDEFKKLLEDYESFDKTKCQEEAGEVKSISELYETRNDKKKICDDEAGEPATTISQAETLLKGLRAIKMILKGQNISINEVEKLEILDK